MKTFMIAIVFSLAAKVCAEFQNNYFLPGDAFFSTSLTEEKATLIQDGPLGLILLDYQRLDNRSIPGGHLGYSGLKLTGVEAGFRSNFLAAYEEMRSLEETTFIKMGSGEDEELFEWNPVVALVYNKGKVAFPLGLKFNENWKEEGEDEYCGFLNDGWSILQDWKRGEKVPPLKLSEDLDPEEHHDLARGIVPKVVRTPLLMEASNAEIVFVGLLKQRMGDGADCPELKALARFANWREVSAKPAYAFYLRVTSEQVMKTIYDAGHRSEWLLDDEGEWAEMNPADRTRDEEGR